ncbi:M3 family metallopeptidase [Brevundimonas sp. 2R-24]|uniref:M3 family metallopeptidase n=1 Tax=Peiella sedimenti TaxID=3061083 RepID=A0ABT8SKB3_9CAUL|nr:M3 family metallopeptidase [Caulobacteraceae bacterium XZ-24]
MKTFLYASAAAAVLLTGCATATAPPEAPRAVAEDVNPVLAEWTGPYGGVPAFDRIRPEHFVPAFNEALAMRDREIAAIVNNRAAPTFENTIEALERSGAAYDRVTRLLLIYTSNMNDAPMQAVDAELAPRQAAAADALVLNGPLFQRIEAVWNNREQANLTPEQHRLLWRTYDNFVRQGARLTPAQKTRMAEINQQLASLYTTFSQRVLSDEASYITVTDEAQLAGIPDSVKAAMRAAAQENGVPGWAIVNTRSAVDPVLTYAQNRQLREYVWRGFINRGDNGDDNDTNAVIAQIMPLRAEKAQLLGYETYADWKLSNTMAQDPDRAMDLMMRVWRPAVARVREEVAEMQAIADREGANITIEPWDYRFYMEKVRRERYDLDQNDLKPYFALENMIQGAMWSAGRLYGLQFNEITGQVPTFHPDVRVWEVKDANGGFVGLFYGDNFARSIKRSGAWEFAYRSQNRQGGNIRPLVSNNNNFVKGAPGEPVLISLDDAETLFHEFGHALHDLLSDVNYASLSGTNTSTDFVEFPSQVNEHWLLTREVLDRFARHYQTGEPMPQALLDKVQAMQTFNQGFATVEFLASGIVDMRMHQVPGGRVDPDAFERQALAELGMPREIVMRHRLPQFNHLFADEGYAAGYYSYLWSETMDADAWEAFEETGDVWNPEVAARMRAMFAAGDSRDQGELYRQFRGRDPDVTALLRQRGFPVD